MTREDYIQETADLMIESGMFSKRSVAVHFMEISTDRSLSLEARIVIGIIASKKRDDFDFATITSADVAEACKEAPRAVNGALDGLLALLPASGRA